MLSRQSPFSYMLAITGAIRGTSRDKPYHELGFESLVSRKCFPKPSAFITFSRLSDLGIYSMFIRNFESLISFKDKVLKFNVLPKIVSFFEIIQREYIFELTDFNTVEVILYGRKFLYISSNTNVVNTTIDFLLETKRFDERLFESKNQLSHGLLYFHFLSLTFLIYLLFSLIYFIVSFYFSPGHTKQIMSGDCTFYML